MSDHDPSHLFCDLMVVVWGVPVISLDRFVALKGIEHIDLLKLGTQGAESAVLRVRKAACRAN